MRNKSKNPKNRNGFKGFFEEITVRYRINTVALIVNISKMNLLIFEEILTPFLMILHALMHDVIPL